MVTGGTGFLGQRIVQELIQPDSLFEVKQLRIFAINARVTFDDARISVVQGDVRNEEHVMKAVDGVDVVIHAAAMVDWGTKKPKEVYDVNFNGTKNILNACLHHGVKALVSTSSVDAIYTGKPLRDIDESGPYPAVYSNMYGQSKSEAEQLVLKSSNENLKTAVIRPADIWGEDDPYHLKALFDMANKGFYVRLGNGSSKCQHVYVGNCAHGHVMLAKALIEGNEKVEGQAYFVTDSPAENFFTFFDRIVLATGQRIWPRNLWIPKNIGWCIGAISELIAVLMRPIKYYNPNFSRFAVNYTCTDLTFSSKKAERDFGYSNKYTITMAVNNTVRYYKEKIRPS